MYLFHHHNLEMSACNTHKRNIYNFSACLECIYLITLMYILVDNTNRFDSLMLVLLSMYVWGICEHKEEKMKKNGYFTPCTSSAGKGSTEMERKGIINTTF